MKKFLKIFILSFICFVLVMSTGTYVFLNSISQGQNDKSLLDDEQQMLKDDERINVLLVGVDTKDGNTRNGSRTDTIMLATFHSKLKKLDIISIPRDTRVTIMRRNGKDKINHAHVYGGMDYAKQAVEDLLGVKVHYYMKIDYNGLERIVDYLGGVEIDVPIDMNYYDPYADPPLKIDLKRGRQTLDGKKALQFIRFRKGYSDQDLGRINAQHTFLIALADKLLESKNIIKLPKLLKTFSSYVETDMPITVMTSYGLKGATIKTENIHMMTIPGEPKFINGISYYIPDAEKLKSIINDIFYNNTSIHDSNNYMRKNSRVIVEVLNGSDINGLAAEIARKLENKGYNVINIGNIKGIEYSQTHIYDRKNKEIEAKQIAKILGLGNIEKDINVKSKVDITIVVGSDIKK